MMGIASLHPSYPSLLLRLHLDISPYLSYIRPTRSFKDAFREGIPECGAGAVPADGAIRLRSPGGSGIMPADTTIGA